MVQLISPTRLVEPSRPVYRPRAVTFDGTNDYMLRGADLTGAADSGVGMASFWFKLNGGNAASQRVLANNTIANGSGTREVTLVRTAANKMAFSVGAAGAANVLTALSAADHVADGTWHHALMSWATNFTAGNKIAQIYIDDASDLGVVTDADTAFSNIDYTVANWSIGADVAATERVNMDIADLLFYTAERLDISVEANRRKFISSAKSRCDLDLTARSRPAKSPSFSSKDMRISSVQTAEAAATSLLPGHLPMLRPGRELGVS